MDILDFSNRCSDLSAEAERLARRTKTKASLMKFFCALFNFSIIALGIGVGVVGVVGCGQNTASAISQAGFYLVTAMGFLISSLKGVLSATGLEQRAVLNKQLSLRLAKISRSFYLLQQSHDEDCTRLLQILEEEFEQMILQSFEMGTEIPRSSKNNISLV